MCKYSFLVPVYNVEGYLRKCVDSILSQDYSQNEYEIILVDDGSTDGSGEICDEYSNRYSSVLTIHQENRGLLQARGTGVAASKGEYLLFIDSDDFIESSLLSIVDDYILEFEPDYLSYGYYIESEGKSIRHPITSEETGLLDKSDMFMRFAASDKYNSIWNKVVRGDILRQHMDEIYNFRTNIGEDKVQTAYILKYSQKIIMIKECLYHYNLRNTSITHYKTEEDIHSIINVYDKIDKVIYDTVDEFDIDRKHKDRLIRDYKPQTLNSVLDHIYKLNKRKDISREDKYLSLDRIIAYNRTFFSDRNKVFSGIRLYNIPRYMLLTKGCFRTLVFTDMIIQNMMEVILAKSCKGA